MNQFDLCCVCFWKFFTAARLFWSDMQIGVRMDGLSWQLASVCVFGYPFHFSQQVSGSGFLRWPTWRTCYWSAVPGEKTVGTLRLLVRWVGNANFMQISRLTLVYVCFRIVHARTHRPSCFLPCRRARIFCLFVANSRNYGRTYIFAWPILWSVRMSMENAREEVARAVGIVERIASSLFVFWNLWLEQFRDLKLYFGNFGNFILEIWILNFARHWHFSVVYHPAWMFRQRHQRERSDPIIT